ncbi:MAG: aldehyde dehydrogenase family protein [FCB group bacterium]|nr:aldehyde dehydrogenase family protein [FCB group bacterium]
MNKRLDIRKTYKLYINGKFPRTESGRYYEWRAVGGSPVVNICRGSRKDFREAVVAARKAFGSWMGRTAYNRGQILYRIAEMLEGRRRQFVDELQLQGAKKQAAEREVDMAVDRLIYYAGWADKYQQVFSCVNPVAQPYFNFSVPEATGVVSIVASETSSLLGLVSVAAPVIVGGNTTVVLASNTKPLCALTWAEVLQTSDVPPGVVNIITGFREELLEHFASHMDVNAIVYCGEDSSEIKLAEEKSALNIKRTIILPDRDWDNPEAQGPYHIMKTQEIKTTWHPVGV